MERRYILVAVNTCTGKRTPVSRTNEPLTHKEACRMRSAFNPHPARRIELQEVQEIQEVCNDNHHSI